MRLFAAIPVSAEVRDLVGSILAELAPRAWPVRWVRPDGVHLTVKFYGEVPEPQAPALIEGLEAAARGTGSVPVSVGGAGAFPASGRPRVIWLGVDAPGALELLHHRVEVSAAALGFPGDGRPYRPHLTLGRVRERARVPREAASVLDEMTRHATFVADRLVLYHSVLSSAGAAHRPLATVSLDAA